MEIESMKRISVGINEELLAEIERFALRHQWSRDKASAELLWRAVKAERRSEVRRIQRIKSIQSDTK
jgi:metal-responsive CopG/Arc/MetJ family transcriptional regulator